VMADRPLLFLKTRCPMRVPPRFFLPHSYLLLCPRVYFPKSPFALSMVSSRFLCWPPTGAHLFPRFICRLQWSECRIVHCSPPLLLFVTFTLFFLTLAEVFLRFVDDAIATVEVRERCFFFPSFPVSSIKFSINLFSTSTTGSLPGAPPSSSPFFSLGPVRTFPSQIPSFPRLGPVLPPTSPSKSLADDLDPVSFSVVAPPRRIAGSLVGSKIDPFFAFPQRFFSRFLSTIFSLMAIFDGASGLHRSLR